MCKRTNRSFVSGWHKINPLKALWLFFVALVLITGSSALGAVQSSPAKQAKVTNKKGIIQKALKLNMPFIANQGQIKDERVRFYAKTFGGAVYVTQKGEMIYSFPPSPNPKSEVRGQRSEVRDQKSKGFVLKETLVGAKIVGLKGVDLHRQRSTTLSAMIKPNGRPIFPPTVRSVLGRFIKALACL